MFLKHGHIFFDSKDEFNAYLKKTGFKVIYVNVSTKYEGYKFYSCQHRSVYVPDND